MIKKAAAMKKKIAAILGRIGSVVTAVITLVVMCGAPSIAFASDGDAFEKEETVYVVTNSEGVENDVIVSDHLINKNKVDTIRDKTTLSDIENVKGKEKFKQKGDNIIWNAGGNDIYYQGRTTAEIPVKLQVKYFLEGKEVSGTDLQGKSGDVTIKIRYTNNAKYNGQTVPMILMSGLVITDNSFTDIKIDNGKVVNMGDKTVVAGLAAPGLAGSVNISESDLGIGSTVTIRGKAHKFAVKDIMTIATNDVFDNVDTSKLDDLDYDSQIKELDSGAKKLVKGSEKLCDGLASLNSKTPALKNGVSKLSEGSKKLLAGINKGLNGILENLNTLGEINTSLNNGLAAVNGYNGDIATKSTGVAGYVGKVSGHGNSLSETQSSNLKKAVDEVSGLSATDKEIIKAALDTQIAVNSAEQIDSKAASNAAAIVTDAETNKALLNGVGEGTEHQKGLIEAAAGESQYIAGLKSAVSQQLDNTSSGTMSGGATQLAAGLTELDESAGQLQSGVQQLSDGSETLNKGMSRLYKQGIKKIVDLYNNKLKCLTSNLSTIVKAGKGYKTFTILPSGMDGNVKFIYKTTINK